MTTDDISDEMNVLWLRAIEDAAYYKDSFIPLDRMHRYVSGLSGDDRAAAERTLVRWALSDESRRRFTSLAMIREFSLREAIPALRTLSDRLQTEAGPRPRDEREKVEGLIEQLSAQSAPTSSD